MKKLIVITMVLAIVSVASAGPAWVFSVGGSSVDQVALGDTVTASLTNDALAGLTITGGTLSVSSVEIDSSSILEKTFGGDPVVAGNTLTMGAYVFGAGAVAGYEAGDEILGITFTVNEAAVTAGQIDITSSLMYAQGAAPVAFPGASIPVVPEPMTMALLGLGGLFIRRRRA